MKDTTYNKLTVYLLQVVGTAELVKLMVNFVED
jgi:hypothetical protein